MVGELSSPVNVRGLGMLSVPEGRSLSLVDGVAASFPVAEGGTVLVESCVSIGLAGEVSLGMTQDRINLPAIVDDLGM